MAVARRLLCLTILLPFPAAATPAAEPVRFVTWNAFAAFSPEVVAQRREQLAAAGRELRPTILVLQEVASHEVVAALRDALGLTGYHVACSTFSGHEPPPDPAAPDYDPNWQFGRLEVGIISRYPLTQVIEFDPSPDNEPPLGDVAEVKLEPALKLGIPRPLVGGRGFLWVRLDDPPLTIAVVHLKSSRGEDGGGDLVNAQGREFVAAAVAASVLEDRSILPAHTCLVAGDFNVGLADRVKNGLDLRRDAADPLDERQDGYDETHALFGGGIVGGLRMRNLLAGSSTTTYPKHPGSPIDTIYVAGPLAERFSPAEILTDTFGSDHRPVITVLPPEE